MLLLLEIILGALGVLLSPYCPSLQYQSPPHPTSYLFLTIHLTQHQHPE